MAVQIVCRTRVDAVALGNARLAKYAMVAMQNIRLHRIFCTPNHMYKNVCTLDTVNGVLFEWDEAKNLANQRKHGVSFEAASRVFDDPLYVSVAERIVDGEQRWQTFGWVDEVLLLMVAHTVRELEEDGMAVEVMRIITARQATSHERRRYEDEDGSV